MKKVLLLTGALALLLGSAALAGPPAKKAPAVPATIACAVETHDTVDTKLATAKKRYADYGGNRYYFCCGDCVKSFAATPAKYAKNAHIKTPTAAPKPDPKKSR